MCWIVKYIDTITFIKGNIVLLKYYVEYYVYSIIFGADYSASEKLEFCLSEMNQVNQEY